MGGMCRADKGIYRISLGWYMCSLGHMYGAGMGPVHVADGGMHGPGMGHVNGWYILVHVACWGSNRGLA